MRQLQVTLPKEADSAASDVLDAYAHDVSSVEVTLEDGSGVEFTASVNEEDIDDVTAELKGVQDIRSGELSIRVLEQESLIEKGQATRGASTTLSQAELPAQPSS